MTDESETFTDPDDASEEWVDVRMTDPDEGEWDVDVVVVDSQVEYVDLRIKPDHLAAFVECLIDDVSGDRAREILADVADREGVDADIGADGGAGRE